jgi:hypothetical protein
LEDHTLASIAADFVAENRHQLPWPKICDLFNHSMQTKAPAGYNGRKPRQLKERWEGYVNPELTFSFTQEEDEKLIALIRAADQREGRPRIWRWGRLERDFPGRSAKGIQRRAHQLMRALTPVHAISETTIDNELMDYDTLLDMEIDDDC